MPGIEVYTPYVTDRTLRLAHVVERRAFAKDAEARLGKPLVLVSAGIKIDKQFQFGMHLCQKAIKEELEQAGAGDVYSAVIADFTKNV